jgi:myo-inositol-1(or 4)-monophosphatase
MLKSLQEREDLCRAVTRIAEDAGNFMYGEIHQVRVGQIVEKEPNSLVSYVDIQTEEMLVSALHELLPEAGFITEEGTVATGEKEWNWIIDPLDGTTNYLFRLPFYSVSIALAHKDELIIGVIYEPNLKECFYAWKGGGAWLNEHSIKVNDQRTLADSLIATGFPYQTTEMTDKLYDILKFVVLNTRGVRRLGSAALDMAYLACGRFDAYYEATLNSWDIAAGTLIVQEAGGIVTDFQGGNKHLETGELIAGSPLIHGYFLEIIKPL